jgi:acetolactate synthase regulatory subunit
MLAGHIIIIIIIIIITAFRVCCDRAPQVQELNPTSKPCALNRAYRLCSHRGTQVQELRGRNALLTGDVYLSFYVSLHGSIVCECVCVCVCRCM